MLHPVPHQWRHPCDAQHAVLHRMQTRSEVRRACRSRQNGRCPRRAPHPSSPPTRHCGPWEGSWRPRGRTQTAGGAAAGGGAAAWRRRAGGGVRCRPGGRAADRLIAALNEDLLQKSDGSREMLIGPAWLCRAGNLCLQACSEGAQHAHGTDTRPESGTAAVFSCETIIASLRGTQVGFSSRAACSWGRCGLPAASCPPGHSAG